MDSTNNLDYPHRPLCSLPVNKWNQQAGTSNNIFQCRTQSNVTLRPQSTPFSSHNEVYSNMNSLQTRTIHERVSSQNPALWYSNCSQNFLPSNRQSSSVNTQNGIPVVTNGFQVPTHQNFHQNSGFALDPPSLMKSNSIFPQQNTSVHSKHQCIDLTKQSTGTHNGSVSDQQHYRIWKGFLPNYNGERVQSISSYTTTWLPHKQVVCTNKVPPNRQTAYNQFDKKTESWQAVTPLQCPPNYAMAVRQPQGNSGTTNTSSQQVLPVSNMGQRNQQYKVHLNSTFNNAEEPSQQEVEHQMITRIAEDLRNTFPPNSGGYSPWTSSSSFRLERFSSKDGIKVSNMIAEPMTQISPELSLISSKTHCRMDTPQKSSVPNVCPTRNYNRQNSQPNNIHKVGNVIFPQKNISKGILLDLCDTSQLKKMPETLSQETEKTKSTVAHNCQRQEKTIKQSDSSIPSSPSRTGTRAIAIVQPVSQERQFSNKPMTFRELLEKSDQPPRNNSEKSNDSAVCQVVSQKGSELVNNMPVNQHDEPPSQQSEMSDENISQSCKNPTDPEVLISGLSSVPSIPWTTEQLTKVVQDEEKAQLKLRNDLTLPECTKKLICMFWDGNIGNLTCKLREGWYRDLVICVNSFLTNHMTVDSIILSQVKQSFEKQLQNFHVLRDNDIYSEPPYKSTWLNVNEQLEDIEECGFPSLKQTHVVESHSQLDHITTSHNIPAPIPCHIPYKVSPQTRLEPADLRGENPTVENASHVGFCSTQAPNEARSDGSDRVLPQTELEPAKLNEESPTVENPSSVEFCSNPATTETTNSDCIDPHYIFEIQVLSPEKAKIIFEQSEFIVQQSREMDSQPEEVICISEEDDLPDAGEPGSNDTQMVNKPARPIEEACCISKWLEKIYGSNNPSLSKCQCKNGKTFEDCSVSTFNKEGIKKESNLSDISSDRDPNTIRVNEVTDKDKNNHVVTHAECEPHTDLSQLINLPEEDDHTPLMDKEPNNFSSKSKSNNLSVTLIKDPENKDPSSSDGELKLAPVDCTQGNPGTKGSMQSGSSPSFDKETGHSSEFAVVSCISECEENNGQMQLTTDEATKTSFQNEDQTQISEIGAPQETLSLSGKHGTERKRKRLSSHDGIFPVFTESNKLSTSNNSHTSKRTEPLVDPNKRKPLSLNGKAVQLVLYGSTTQQNDVRFGSRNRQTSSLSAVTTAVSRPPEVLAVCFSPLKKLSSEPVPVQEHSVKRKIHEIWKRSFLPTPPKHRKKEKMQECTFLPGTSLKRTAIDTERTLGSSECGIQNWNGSSKHCLSLKKKRSHYEHQKKKRSHYEHQKKKRSHYEHKKKTRKKEKYTITLNQPADKESNSGENKRPDVLPYQNVLNFRILPNTFNFKHDTNQRKEANDSVRALPDHVEGDHNSSNKTTKQLMGTWNLKAKKKYSPQPKADAPKTSSLFNEFQKKYMKKTQTSMDE